MQTDRSKFSNLSNWKEEAWKNQGFNGIRTYGHGIESRWSPDIFRLSLSNCLNLLRWSLFTSASTTWSRIPWHPHYNLELSTSALTLFSLSFLFPFVSVGGGGKEELCVPLFTSTSIDSMVIELTGNIAKFVYLSDKHMPIASRITRECGLF